jgi:tetratricopeptide (TPR) repeat protein
LECGLPLNEKMTKAQTMSEHKNSDETHQALSASAYLLQNGQPQEAIDLLQPLNEGDPTHPDIAINLGGAYVLLRKWDKAVEILIPAAEANAHNAMLWSNLAAAHLGRLELAGPKAQKDAIEAYKRALQADPKAPNVHYNLGLIFKERGELDNAIEMFERALEVAPDDRDASYWLTLLERARDEVNKLEGEDDKAASDANGDGA